MVGERLHLVLRKSEDERVRGLWLVLLAGS